MTRVDLEGLIIESVDGQYYKWLPENEIDGVVVGFTQGTGKYQDAIGALVVKTPDGVKHTVGSGLTACQRFTPFEELKGQAVTIKYKHLLASGALRHPRLQFKEIV
jgi:DNA ligase-1